MKYTSNQSENTDDLWKEITKLAAIFVGTAFAAKQITNKVVNDQRKETALEEFENQDLTWWESHQIKSWFQSHDFYVTKFPDTPREIFPLAVKILYQLIKYHTKSYIDAWLGQNILINCEKLHRIAVKNEICPINEDWQYWKLVQREFGKKIFWGELKFKRKFYTNPDWNLEDFLNEFENGIVRFGIFGVNEKRIDFCYYRKKLFGELIERTEVDEQDNTLEFVWDVINNSQFVAEIYDLSRKQVIDAIQRMLKPAFSHYGLNVTEFTHLRGKYLHIAHHLYESIHTHLDPILKAMQRSNSNAIKKALKILLEFYSDVDKFYKKNEFYRLKSSQISSLENYEQYKNLINALDGFYGQLARFCLDNRIQFPKTKVINNFMYSKYVGFNVKIIHPYDRLYKKFRILIE